MAVHPSALRLPVYWCTLSGFQRHTTASWWKTRRPLSTPHGLCGRYLAEKGQGQSHTMGTFKVRPRKKIVSGCVTDQCIIVTIQNILLDFRKKNNVIATDIWEYNDRNIYFSIVFFLHVPPLHQKFVWFAYIHCMSSTARSALHIVCVL